MRFSAGQKAILLIAFFVLILDRLAKMLSLHIWQFQEANLTPWFKLSFKLNQQISFSLPLPQTLISCGLSLAIVVIIYYLISFARSSQIWPTTLLNLILIGAISNAFDRLLYGGVIDYLHLAHFTVFNLADALISLSSIALIYQCFKIQTNKQA